MTTDTSREAVEALIAEARDYAGEDQCGGAELLRETAQTLVALLDERDAQNGAISTLSHTLGEQQQDIEKLEAEVNRLIREVFWNIERSNLWQERAERAEEQLQAIREVVTGWNGFTGLTREVLAILADTDEGQSNGD